MDTAPSWLIEARDILAQQMCFRATLDRTTSHETAETFSHFCETSDSFRTPGTGGPAAASLSECLQDFCSYLVFSRGQNEDRCNRRGLCRVGFGGLLCRVRALGQSA